MALVSLQNSPKKKPQNTQSKQQHGLSFGFPSAHTKEGVPEPSKFPEPLDVTHTFGALKTNGCGSKSRYSKWSPGKWKGHKPAFVFWWFSLGPPPNVRFPVVGFGAFRGLRPGLLRVPHRQRRFGADPRPGLGQTISKHLACSDAELCGLDCGYVRTTRWLIGYCDVKPVCKNPQKMFWAPVATRSKKSADLVRQAQPRGEAENHSFPRGELVDALACSTYASTDLERASNSNSSMGCCTPKRWLVNSSPFFIWVV